jgi:hypothetical protein
VPEKNCCKTNELLNKMGCTISQQPHSNEPQSLDDSEVLKSIPVVFVGVEIGLVLFCKDEFVSKYTGENMVRWRSSEIKTVEGDDRSRVLIHYIGWSETFDFWLDLHNEWTKVAPAQLLSKQQCDQGVLLNEEQKRCTLHFLKTGEFRRDLPPTVSTGVDKTVLSIGSESSPPANHQNNIGNAVNDKHQPIGGEQSPSKKEKGGLLFAEKKPALAVISSITSATNAEFPHPPVSVENPALLSQFVVGQQVRFYLCFKTCLIPIH